MSAAASHGMSGWFHWSHARICPSGEMRGAATKSGPLTSTSGSDGWWAASRTISLTTSVAPVAGVPLAHADQDLAVRG